jgi:hypothetical protein
VWRAGTAKRVASGKSGGPRRGGHGVHGGHDGSHGRSRPVTASHGRHGRSRPPRRWSRRPGSGGPEGASCGAE